MSALFVPLLLLSFPLPPASNVICYAFQLGDCSKMTQIPKTSAYPDDFNESIRPKYRYEYEHFSIIFEFVELQLWFSSAGIIRGKGSLHLLLSD